MESLAAIIMVLDHYGEGIVPTRHCGGRARKNLIRLCVWEVSEGERAKEIQAESDENEYDRRMLSNDLERFNF